MSLFDLADRGEIVNTDLISLYYKDYDGTVKKIFTRTFGSIPSIYCVSPVLLTFNEKHGKVVVIGGEDR